MNRNLKNIILLASGLLTMASPTCEEEVSPKQRKQERLEQLQAVAGDLRSESLTRRNLDAFEYRAVEKLMDYADYLNIVYDQSLDETFHYQAGENIRDLFTGRSAPENPLPVSIDSGSYNSIKFLIDTIEITTPLERQSKEIYTGSMRYFQKILGITGSDTLNLDTSLHRMGILLQMSLKDFGENSLIVWEVLLSDDN
ncbi:hypothetical protein ACFLTU_01670 [Bacteroidota bacterium]